jgi:hypothetical protein
MTAALLALDLVFTRDVIEEIDAFTANEVDVIKIRAHDFSIEVRERRHV